MRVSQLKREGESGRSAKLSKAPQLPQDKRNLHVPELPGQGPASISTTPPSQEKAMTWTAKQFYSVSYSRQCIITISSPVQLQRLGPDFSASWSTTLVTQILPDISLTC